MQIIEVTLKSHLPDARGQGLVKDIQDLGITTVTDVHVADIYWLNADLPKAQLERIGRDLLADPVTQDYICYTPSAKQTVEKAEKGLFKIEVTNNPGVTDPTEDSIMKAITDLGIKVKAVKTAKRYLIKGKLTKQQLDNVCFRLLINPVIQHVVTEEKYGFIEPPKYKFKLNHIELITGR